MSVIGGKADVIATKADIAFVMPDNALWRLWAWSLPDLQESACPGKFTA
jgi:hypothetical protein